MTVWTVVAALALPLRTMSRSPTHPVRQLWWRVVCGLLVFPFTAMLHHAVFYRPRCLLNPFGHEYTFTVIADMLSRDPALPWAIVLAFATYVAGMRHPGLQAFVWPVPFVFAPLSIWIWDIPFTERIVCRIFHDGRFSVLGYTLRTTTWYIAGTIAYAGLVFTGYARRERPSAAQPYNVMAARSSEGM